MEKKIGISERVAHLIDLKLDGSVDFNIKTIKFPILLLVCALHSELPSNVHIMGLYDK